MKAQNRQPRKQSSEHYCFLLFSFVHIKTPLSNPKTIEVEQKIIKNSSIDHLE